MRSGFAAVLLCAILLPATLPEAVSAQGLFSHEADRAWYEDLLRERRALYPTLEAGLFSVLEHARDDVERDALIFLLATSPLSDLAGEDGTFYLGAVRSTLAGREVFPWAARVPDSLFLHFVLPLRVNNEALDSSRHLFSPLMRERLRGLSMHDAVLEVNHWCHEHVTYAPSDARTRSPLATIRNGLGRCGEESVLTTVALRAAGIPARQVYSPRWAHSDDNHAWVEVWVDSAWYYIGACEPDVDLNRAWFTEPARRAMLITAPVQGRYRGEEDILGGTKLFTRINTLPVYARTQLLQVHVSDSDRVPVSGALVDFRVFNYGEFYPIATLRTDSQGRAAFRTGYGDLLVWARDGDHYTYQMVKAGQKDTVRLTLGGEVPKSRNVILDYEPPRQETITVPSHPKRQEVDRRVRRDDSIRAAYEASFLDSTQAVQVAVRSGCDASVAWRLLHSSRGNWRSIQTFLEAACRIDPPRALHFLEALSVKDLQDAWADVLIAHFRAGLPLMQNLRIVGGVTDEIAMQAMLNPRIGREELRPWRTELQQAAAVMTANRSVAETLIAWVRDSILVVEDENWSRVPVTPDRVYALRVADPASRDIFFVALCRAAGLPARLDPATGRPQYYDSGEWRNAEFDTAAAHAPKDAELQLRLPEVRSILSPQYARHFTIGRFEGGKYHTLDFEGDPRFSSWPVTLQLEPGRYQLVTGNRQSDGSVLSTIEEFTLEAGTPFERTLHIRDNVTKPEVLAEIDEDLLPLSDASYYVLLWIEEGSEPVSHALTDIADERSEFDALPVRFLLAEDGSMNEESLQRIARSSLPENTVIAADGAKELYEELVEELQLPEGTQLPLIVVADSKGSVTFVARGYTVGVGTQILRMLERMRLHP